MKGYKQAPDSWKVGPAALPRYSAGAGQVSASSEPKLVGMAELILAVLLLLACFTSAAHLVQLLFTPLCILMAFYLLQKSNSRYVIFVLFLWFFAPFFRRVADLHAGFLDPSPMLLAPLLASGLPVIVLVKRAHILFSRAALPFSLTLLAISYGLLVGILQVPIRPVIVDFLRWFVPVIFGVYCFTLRDQHKEIFDACKSAFLYGMIIMSLYGIWQSLAPAPWDLYWLAHLDASSFGSGEKVRVFSTMNSPGPFAATVGAGVLLLVASEEKMARIAQILGAAALLLSEVRAAWLGTLAGLLYLFLRANHRTRVKMVVFAAATSIILAAILTLSGFNEQFGTRINTFANLTQDESFEERLGGSQRAMAHALGKPFGGGMGYMESSFVTNQDAGGNDLGSHDNGLLEFLVTLGVPGVILYGGGVLVLLGHGSTSHNRADSTKVACFAVCLGFLAELPLGNSLSGSDGLIFWFAAAMLLGSASTAGRLA